MPTLPETADVAELGGILQNYGAVEDPTTDLDAGADNKNRANTAAMTHTATRAMRRFVGHATTPTDPLSGFVHDSVWGKAPAVKPTVTRAGTGIYLVTFPLSVQDELGVFHDTNLQVAKAWVEFTGTTVYGASARVTAANVVEVRVHTGGALSDAAGLAIVVEVR